MTERVLSHRELNRATLARQLLLDRRRLSALQVVQRLAGMQAQWPAAPYVGIWSRATSFRRETLERAILGGEVVKATVMRGALHLVTRRDYPLFWTALHDIPSWPDPAAISDGVRVAGEIRALALEGPLTAQAAFEHLARQHGLRDLHGRRVWQVARIRGHIVHAPETALWAARPAAVFRAHAEPEPVGKLVAVTEVVRRSLSAFGPATRADLADWSGMRVGDFAAALDALEPLRRFQDEQGRELLDLPRLPLPSGDTPAPVRFLPKWDDVLLGFADRRRVLPEQYRKAVIAKNGDVAQTVLVDGVVAGLWRTEKGRVVVEPLAPLPLNVRTEVEDEGRRLEVFLR